ncbi:MAG: 3-phosphoshikimate 1-carboxyvinyltransferase [Proteobacteria bacterium]|jgi:3-phosphoshikimate 1-carboxyvinyltransferase|nr:3-phosphoshikimate 1-carboxyvinyltransferase [Pseudomonadota bacterium]
MQFYEVQPSTSVAGTVRVPGDKSISHRTLMLGGIAEGRTEVTGFLASADCLATLDAFRAMGVGVDRHAETSLTVHGRGLHGLSAPAKVLDMGNAGTAIRLSMGLLSGQRFESVLTGDSSLRSRPMERVAKPLRQMGADILTTDGKPPVTVRPVATLSGIDYLLPVASAQVKSAILLAGLYAQGFTTVTEPAPTRDHTERMLRGFGVQVETDGARIRLQGRQTLTGTRIDVPGDISSAAFFLVAGSIAGSGDYVIENVGVNPTRTGVIDILKLMGADITVVPRAAQGGEPVADLHVRRAELRGIAVPESLVPLAIDELPVLFIAAAAARGETVFTGAAELRVKESDRLAVMADGLTRLGVGNELAPDGIRIEGLAGTGRRLGGGEVESHGDHRIAMSFTVASLLADAPIRIRDTENVGTSFPGFVATARACGLQVEER